MREKQFEYGPLAQGTFRALIALTLVMPLAFGWWFLPFYILFVIFLGIGLRPFLEITGLYRFLEHFLVLTVEKTDKRFLKRRREEIDRKNRDHKQRKRRLKHPDLPRNW